MAVTLNPNLSNLQSLISQMNPGELAAVEAEMPMLQALAQSGNAYAATSTGSATQISSPNLAAPSPANLSNPSGSGAYPDPSTMNAAQRANLYAELAFANDPNAAAYAPGASGTGAPVNFFAGPTQTTTGQPAGYAPGTDPLTPTTAGPDYTQANSSYLNQLSPEEQAMFKLQQQMDQQSQAASLVAALEKSRHDAMMAVIQKIS